MHVPETPGGIRDRFYPKQLQTDSCQSLRAEMEDQVQPAGGGLPGGGVGSLEHAGACQVEEEQRPLQT